MKDEIKVMLDEGYSVEEIADMVAEGDEDIKAGVIEEINVLADAADEVDREDEDKDKDKVKNED